MKKQKVMHIISGLHTGGAEMMLYRLLANSNEFQAVVVSLSQGGEFVTKIRALGIEVVELPRQSFFNMSRQLLDVIELYKPDLLQSWLYRADLLASMAGLIKKVPVVWNVRQTETKRVAAQTHIWCIQRINARISRFLPAEIVYCAEAAMNSHRHIGYDQSKGVVIANGIDTKQFCPDSSLRQQSRSILGIDDHTILIGMVARFDPLKNHARFFRVARQVIQKLPERKIKLLLIGNGMDAENSALLDMINHEYLADHCILLGKRADIPSLYNALDVHLLTSDNEGWPNVLGEALSSGTLCVATNVGDVANILSIDPAAVVNPDDEMMIADSVIRLVNLPPKEQQQWSINARQCIEKDYSIDQTVDRYNRLYSSFRRSDNEKSK